MSRRSRSTRTAATGPAKKYGPAEWSAWARAYEEGKTFAELAELYDVAPSTVMRRVHGLGVAGRDRQKTRMVRSVVKARRGGMRPVEIARTLGLGRATVYRYLREADGKPPYVDKRTGPVAEPASGG